MVGDEGSIHFADFYLHCVLQESSSDEIHVLSFKTLQWSSFLIDFIVFIILIVFDIISDWGTGSWLYLKDIIVAIFVDTSAVDLGSKENLIVHVRISIVIGNSFLSLPWHYGLGFLFLV